MPLEEVPNIEPRDAAISPLMRLERMETHDWLYGCIAALPERDQTAIRLVDIECKTIGEAAKAIEMSHAATKAFTSGPVSG